MHVGLMFLPLAFLNDMFGVDGLVVLIIGLLIFGRRLPEVGGNLRRVAKDVAPGMTALEVIITVLILLAGCALVYQVTRPY